jgi:rhamnosyltransferase
MPNSVAAIVVTFGASLSEVESIVRLIKDQVAQVILVDNGSPSLKKLKSTSRFHIIRLKKNYGLAYAQNVGIERAIKLKVDHVLFIDQDSVPNPDMVNKLLFHFTKATRLNLHPAAMGPVTIDRRIGIKSSFVVKRFGLPSHYRKTDQMKDSILLVHFLISSGSLVSIDALKRIGGLRSDYFIDHVDSEWCLRAQGLGFSIFSAFDALMQHTLGDTIKQIWLLGWRSVSWHQPYRDYYVYRNTLLAIRDARPSFIWQCFLISRLFKFFIYFMLAYPNRLKRLRYIYLGLRDGIFNRRGRIDEKTFKLHAIPKTSLDPI